MSARARPYPMKRLGVLARTRPMRGVPQRCREQLHLRSAPGRQATAASAPTERSSARLVAAKGRSMKNDMLAALCSTSPAVGRGMSENGFYVHSAVEVRVLSSSEPAQGYTFPVAAVGQRSAVNRAAALALGRGRMSAWAGAATVGRAVAPLSVIPGAQGSSPPPARRRGWR